jgi:16S rRNA (uracil1498-N3)-methyltransferase
VEKLERYVIEASKQCGRNVLMKIHALEQWEKFARRTDLPIKRFLADPIGTACNGWSPSEEVLAAVGPEGGFTPDELAAAHEAGWQLVSLGPRVLRVETAALALAAVFEIATQCSRGS